MLGTPKINLEPNNPLKGLTSLRYAIKIATTICLNKKRQ